MRKGSVNINLLTNLQLNVTCSNGKVICVNADAFIPNEMKDPEFFKNNPTSKKNF